MTIQRRPELRSCKFEFRCACGERVLLHEPIYRAADGWRCVECWLDGPDRQGPPMVTVETMVDRLSV